MCHIDKILSKLVRKVLKIISYQIRVLVRASNG